MIFKYFSYDRLNKNWCDSKNYISICKNAAAKNGTIAQDIHASLISKKLISVPFEYFSVSNGSSKNRASYTLYTVTNGRRVYLGKLSQLLSKTDADTFGTKKKENPFADMHFTTTRTMRFDEIWGAPTASISYAGGLYANIRLT